MCIHLRAAFLAGAVTLSWPVAAQTLPDTFEPEMAAAVEEAEEEEEIVVQGTRVRRRLRDEPIRVEVLAREEIEEKAIMRPGNIAMLLAETGGLRVQTTAPALGAANILDVRQSKVDPLLRPTRAASGEWTVDAWSPLEGRIFNAGVRLRFGSTEH